MIFVSVGTHEQPFDRLLRQLDLLKERGQLQEAVFIQSGYSTYQPQHCDWAPFCSYQEMVRRTQEAHIVITHGGPSSFMLPIHMGKIPIVVPRQAQYGEHVNDHQLEFCRRVSGEGRIILVEDISGLGDAISSYEETIAGMTVGYQSNTEQFAKRLEEIVQELIGD